MTRGRLRQAAEVGQRRKLMLRGVDVSSYQGAVPWDRVASELSCRFAIVKIAEGTLTIPDPWAARNLAGARAAGLKVGGYFFLHPERNIDLQASTHAKLALDLGLGEEGSLPCFVDFESPEPQMWGAMHLTAAGLRTAGLAYCQALEGLLGRTPGLYTYPDFWKELQGALEPRFARFPLWMASYPGGEKWPEAGQAPLIPRPWTSWAFWQWTAQGKLPNDAADDFDVFNGDEDALEAICVPAKTTPTTDPAAGS
jgi:lysozyme